jgi:selenide,water dikinase
VLGQLPAITDVNVLVGSANEDDAGVYRLSDDSAVVLTTDFFTPIVDDPYWFGAIAAANSLSDVWAMGARPVIALNLAMFPHQPEFLPLLQKIMKGGTDKMTEAGVSIVGGHTIRDKEPKFGYTVMGVVHPDKVLHNAKARPGDSLVLTKKIGTGVLSTALKAGKWGGAAIDEFTLSMAALNRKAGEIMVEVGVDTATDISGFGLIGHLLEVLRASDCTAQLYSSSIPFFNDALELAGAGMIPGGTKENRRTFEPYVSWEPDVTENERVLLNDAQTSGGLLIFIPAAPRDRLIDILQKEGVQAAHIGDVVAPGAKDNKRVFVNR